MISAVYLLQLKNRKWVIRKDNCYEYMYLPVDGIWGILSEAFEFSEDAARQYIADHEWYIMHEYSWPNSSMYLG